MPTLETAPIEILITAEALDARIREMGAELSVAYADQHPILVCVLKGAIPFFARLGESITIPVQYDCILAQSYHGGTESVGTVHISTEMGIDVKGRHVVLVEDIVDTGLTIQALKDVLSGRGAVSVKVATLLDKPARRRVQVTPDFTGFSIPDAFVIGFGLDYAQYYRNLPYVGILREVPTLPE